MPKANGTTKAILPALRGWDCALHFRDGSSDMEIKRLAGRIAGSTSGFFAGRVRRLFYLARFGGKEAFIRRYCERSGITWEFLSKRRVVVPCDCGDPICEGWAMVPRDDDPHESV
jgi:hypothetical protein